jgi:NADPH2:quinone reductase
MNGDENEMRAVLLDAFGDAESLRLGRTARPAPGPRDVLIRVAAAGIGAWDAEERSGHYDGIFGLPSRFPYILGWDGAGLVEETGAEVTRFRPGDRVMAASMPLPRGGFYAEFAVVDQAHVAVIPPGLTMEQAACLPWDGLTAQSGLDALAAKAGDALMIIGASGGIGHLALQLAKARGAKVLAVVSGEDGVRLGIELGADSVVDGRRDDIVQAARTFAPDGLDGILTMVGGQAIDAVIGQLGSTVRIAAPLGVHPEPISASGNLTLYNGDRGSDAFAKLSEAVVEGGLRIHVAETFPLERAVEAHKRLERHYVGKLALTI